jgi:hypothetical protein
MIIENTMLAWFARKRGKWLALLLLVAMGCGLVKLYKEITMPPPLVYLIPESYLGPVFAFFDQKDGVDVQPDPLGNSVWVPENGVVKIKQKVGEVVGESREGYRATYVISVTKDGNRKILKFNGNTQRDENGEWVNFYFDENSKLHKFPVNKSKGPFYFFSEDQKTSVWYSTMMAVPISLTSMKKRLERLPLAVSF